MGEKETKDLNWGMNEDWEDNWEDNWEDDMSLASADEPATSDAPGDGVDEESKDHKCEPVLGNEAGSSASGEEVEDEWACPELMDSGKRRLPPVGSGVLPVAISRIVADYLSDSSSEYARTVLAGVQPITLCLAPDINSKLGSCWYLGCLSPEQQFGSFEVKVDKQFAIADYESCLGFLSEKTSKFCHVAVEVLVVKLKMFGHGNPSTLTDLRRAIGKLQGYLNNVKHVVISVLKYASCCFYLQDPIDKTTGLPQLFDHQQALCHIVDDLDTCWKNNNSLDAPHLCSFYLQSDIKPTSEKYLSKLVILLNDPATYTLFMEQETSMVSDKMMWVSHMKSLEEFPFIDKQTTRLCRAIYLDSTDLLLAAEQHFGGDSPLAVFAQNNVFVERIVLRSPQLLCQVELPRPSEPFLDATPRSALIELSLEGKGITLPLSQLNMKGFFPNLMHLSMIGINIAGHLDSHCVPRLRTLNIDLDNYNEQFGPTANPHAKKHCQSLIDTGHPWQLVASRKPGGWSLASYDEPIANPQGNSPLSRPFIRDLLLFMRTPLNANEWRSRLNGHPSLEPFSHVDKKGLLVWAPERVEKISAFGSPNGHSKLEFKETLPGRIRILKSFFSRRVRVLFHGSVVPDLQSLEVHNANTGLVGSFPQLQTLLLDDGKLLATHRLDAPSLQSLQWRNLLIGPALILRPEFLPDLSFLRITLRSDEPQVVPIKIEESDLGLSRVEKIVLGKGVRLATFVDQYQVHLVSHLELWVNALQLPSKWNNAEWQCETLTIHFHAFTFEHSGEKKSNVVEMSPPLPIVKKLTVTEDNCHLLLNREMLELTELTVPSPRSLGPNLRCPALKWIMFTGKLSEKEKVEYSNPATYQAFGARPKVVRFDFYHQIHTLDWDGISQ